MLKKSRGDVVVCHGLSVHLFLIRLEVLYVIQKNLLYPLQVYNICTPNETACTTAMRKDSFGCRVSCTGLNADVSISEDTSKDGAMIQDSKVFSQLIKEYNAYKSAFVKNLKFNSTSLNLGKVFLMKLILI